MRFLKYNTNSVIVVIDTGICNGFDKDSTVRCRRMTGEELPKMDKMERRKP